MAALEPKQDSRGRYYRNLGYISPENRQQPKLFLGKDKVQATARLCRNTINATPLSRESRFRRLRLLRLNFTRSG